MSTPVRTWSIQRRLCRYQPRSDTPGVVFCQFWTREWTEAESWQELPRPFPNASLGWWFWTLVIAHCLEAEPWHWPSTPATECAPLTFCSWDVKCIVVTVLGTSPFSKRGKHCKHNEFHIWMRIQRLSLIIVRRFRTNLFMRDVALASCKRHGEHKSYASWDQMALCACFFFWCTSKEASNIWLNSIEQHAAREKKPRWLRMQSYTGLCPMPRLSKQRWEFSVFGCNAEQRGHGSCKPFMNEM